MPFSNWHPFTKVEIAKAPTYKGVYELCDAKGEIVYIGSSETSVLSRLVAHKKETRFMEVKQFHFMRVSDDRLWTTAKHIERSLCAKFRKEHGRLPRFQKRSPKNINILDWLP